MSLKNQLHTLAFKPILAFKRVIFTIDVPKPSGVWADTPPYSLIVTFLQVATPFILDIVVCNILIMFDFSQ